MLKLFFMSLTNSLLRNWRRSGESRTAATSNMELFVTMVHGCQSLLTIVTMNAMLDVLAAVLDPPLYVDILHNVLQVLQILNYL